MLMQQMYVHTFIKQCMYIYFLFQTNSPVSPTLLRYLCHP